MARSILMDDVLESNKDEMMYNENCRIESFQTWPFLNGSCTKEKMAQAGFYKCNLSKDDIDTVRCFVCLTEIFDWKENDDPFKKHLKCSKDCSFAQLQMPQNNFTLSNWLQIRQEGSRLKHTLRIKLKIERIKKSCNELNEGLLA